MQPGNLTWEERRRQAHAKRQAAKVEALRAFALEAPRRRDRRSEGPQEFRLVIVNCL